MPANLNESLIRKLIIYLDHFQSQRQWLLELMGQIRSNSRLTSATKSPTSFVHLFDIFCLSLATFANLDALIYPRAKLFAPDALKLRRDLLPVALTQLFKGQDNLWSSLGPQLGEWMIQIVGDKETPEECKEAMKKSFTAFKICDKYSEATMWSRLVPLASDRA